MPVELDAVHTRRDLYFRIARTRQIQQLWASVGKHLNNPRHRLTRPAEAADLIHHMQALTQLIQSFPSRLGQAGQPGYLVLALARQQLIVPTLQTLLHEPVNGRWPEIGRRARNSWSNKTACCAAGAARYAAAPPGITWCASPARC